MQIATAKVRRSWTSEEDEALLFLKENLLIKKWSEVARQMASISNLSNLQQRTQKQCRDRYANFLKNGDHSYKWKIQDQRKLIDLYYQVGNKWSEIANHFPNTNGIYIKNKFYSRLRKAIRHLNIIIDSHFSQTYSKFPFDIIFKLVNNANNKHHLSESSQIGKLVNSNPNFFEDVIFQLINMTDDQTNNILKKKKLKIFILKDQVMWRKIIDILNFLTKSGQKTVTADHFEQNHHLQTDHHQDIKSLHPEKLQNYYCFPRKSMEQMNYGEVNMKRQIQASYIQFQDKVQQTCYRCRNPIVIICDSKNNYKVQDEIKIGSDITSLKNQVAWTKASLDYFKIIPNGHINNMPDNSFKVNQKRSLQIQIFRISHTKGRKHCAMTRGFWKQSKGE